MKYQELKNLSLQELQDKAEDLRKQLMEYSFKRKTGQVEKPHNFVLIKKDIARVLTAIREKENGEN